MSTYSNFTIAALDGALNGTTPVTILTGPSSGAYMLKSLYISNGDTGPVTITLNYVDSSTNRQLWKGTLNPNDTLQIDENDFIVLDSNSKSVAAVMSAAAATTNPSYVGAYTTQS